jgi:hypothetical protein
MSTPAVHRQLGREGTKPGVDILEITDFSEDINIAGRHIEVITAGGGAIVLTTPGGDRTLTVYDHWQKPLEFSKIVAVGTTVTKIQVMT